jgi:hypothetical protein
MAARDGAAAGGPKTATLRIWIADDVLIGGSSVVG